MAKKRRTRPRFTVGGFLNSMENRIAELERRVDANHRGLEVQFERIATIQADVDRLRAYLKRSD